MIGRTQGSARSFAAWLGLHALLLQLLLPVLHHPAHLVAAASEPVASGVAIADSGSAKPPGHDHGGDTAMPDCPLCLAVQHAVSFLPPTAPSLPSPLATRLVTHARFATATIRWQNLTARARGPPLAA
jgi:hypothetical protein